MAKRKVGPRGYSRKSANTPYKPKSPRLNVIEGGKEITPDKTNKPKTGISFIDKVFRPIVGLGAKANVFVEVLRPTPLADGTIPEGWRPPAPSVDMSAQDIKIGSLDITVYSKDEIPTRVDPAVVRLPPQPPTYISDLPIKVDPRAPVVRDGEIEVIYEPLSKLGTPPQQMELTKTKFISSNDVHVGNPVSEVVQSIRNNPRIYEDARWLGMPDVIITSTDYKPYDQEAEIEKYEAWLAEQNKLISNIDLHVQPEVLADGSVVNMVKSVTYSEEKLTSLNKPESKYKFDKWTELSVEVLTETMVTAQTRLAVRAGSNFKRHRDGKSRYGEAYLALKRVVDATIGGEIPELYFMFTDNLYSKPMGRRRPPMKKGYLTFWDSRVQQWRYKAKTPYGIYEGYQSGFLELDMQGFLIDVAINFVEDAAIGKVSRLAKRGHDSMLQQFGKTDREIGFQFGPTL